MSWASDASATAYGGATLSITHLIMSSAPAFSSSGQTFTASTSAALDTTGGQSDSKSRTLAFAPSDGVNVDPLESYKADPAINGPGLGSGFGLHPGSNPSFSRSDGILTNTKINASGDVSGGGGAFKAVSETKVAINHGVAESTNGQQWNFGSLAFTTTTTVHFSMDADLLMQAFLTLDETGSATGKSTFTMAFNFTHIGSVGVDHGTNLQTSTSTLSAVPGGGESPSNRTEDDILCPAGCDLGTFANVDNGATNTITWDEVILAGSYTFTIDTDVKSEARAEAVPEPATLSLLGVGLLGAGLVARRRRKAA